MNECLFCQIAAGKIPAQKLIETDLVVAFKDIQPQAPVHVLVVPKKHIRNMFEFDKKDVTLLTALFEVIDQVVESEDLKTRGFRIVVNTGVDGQQAVDHLHFHVLGGRAMHWPPG